MAASVFRLVNPNNLLNIASFTPPCAYKMLYTATPLRMVRTVRRSRVDLEAKNKENTPIISEELEPNSPCSPSPRADDTVMTVDMRRENTFLQKSMKEEKMRFKALNEKFKYEKAGRDDKRLGRLVMMVKSRKFREQKGWIMLEGRRLITDAIDAGLRPHTIFFSRVENLEDIPVQKTSATLIKAPFKDIAMWSDLVTTQGVIGVFKKPTHQNMHVSQSTPMPLTLICDNVREPGNLGTILRSAVAAHCEKIILTKGCVDLWEPKVLRSGAGAHFYMPILTNVSWKEVPNHLEEDVIVHVADNNIFQEDLSETDSRTRHLKNQDRENANHSTKLNQHHHGYQDESDAEEIFVGSKFYHQVDWKAKSALVIGGETEGLSHSTLTMCNKTLGCRVHIPMATAVDSLNSAVSASVILFEALRQNFVVEKN